MFLSTFLIIFKSTYSTISDDLSLYYFTHFFFFMNGGDQKMLVHNKKLDSNSTVTAQMYVHYSQRIFLLVKTYFLSLKYISYNTILYFNTINLSVMMNCEKFE